MGDRRLGCRASPQCQLFPPTLSAPAGSLSPSTRSMESVRELQDPLLAKAHGHLRGTYSYHQHHSQDYPSHRCQGKLYSYIFQNTGGARTHQLLDASSLQLAVEALYGPNFILVKDETALKAKDSKAESCETTFTESKEAPSDGPDGHEAQGSRLVESDIRIQTVSYEVEEEELQEYEVSSARWDGTKRLLCYLWSNFLGIHYLFFPFSFAPRPHHLLSHPSLSVHQGFLPPPYNFQPVSLTADLRRRPPASQVPEAGSAGCPAQSTALPQPRASPTAVYHSEDRLPGKPWPNAGGFVAADLSNGIAKRTGHIAALLQPLSLNF